MEWVSAKALIEAMGSPVLPAYSGQAQAICKRAHAGLLRARAQMFCTKNEEREDVDVPKLFWWAEGHEALEQDWETGDFSTWIDGQYELRAFGVRFCKEDAEKMGAVFDIQTAPGEAGKNKGGAPKDQVRWQAFWFAVIELAQDGRLSRTSFQTQTALREEILLMLGEGGLSDPSIKPVVQQIWQKFVDSQG